MARSHCFPVASPCGQTSRRPSRSRRSERKTGSIRITLELETQPENPYSVRVGFTLKNGQVYIDPAEDRRRYQHLVTDPSVRVRFSTAVYLARAVEVHNATELEGFDPTRHVYRLEVTQKP